MYHSYKHKGGGYFKGISNSGKHFTSKYPPLPKGIKCIAKSKVNPE